MAGAPAAISTRLMAPTIPTAAPGLAGTAALAVFITAE